jgi:ribose 5-phosphate isomerase B
MKMRRTKMNKIKIALGSDHAGFELKEEIKKYLESLNCAYYDFGTHSTESVDYPDFCFPVAEKVASKEFDFGILVCATGIGMSIAANKVKGVRAALCCYPETARLTREHNNSNILTLGARFIKPDIAKEIVKIFIETSFEGERHLRRINKIKDYDENRR